MLRQRRIIWFAIAFSTVIYAAIAYAMAAQTPPGPFDDAVRQPMVAPLYALAAATFLFAMFGLGRFRLGNAQKAMVVRLALFEACAIYGLVAAFLYHDWRLYLAPWALALLGFLRAWPGGEEAATPSP